MTEREIDLISECLNLMRESFYPTSQETIQERVVQEICLYRIEELLGYLAVLQAYLFIKPDKKQ